MPKFRDLGVQMVRGKRTFDMIRVDRDPEKGQYAFDEETGVYTFARADSVKRGQRNPQRVQLNYLMTGALATISCLNAHDWRRHAREASEMGQVIELGATTRRRMIAAGIDVKGVTHMRRCRHGVRHRQE